MVSSVTQSDSISRMLSYLSSTINSVSDTTTSATSTTTTSTSPSTATSVAGLSESDLTTAFQQLASTLQAALLQEQSSGGQTAATPDGDHQGGGTAHLSQLFSKLDTNNDGTVNEAEFVAGRPPGMTSDQAASLWGKIDSSGATSLTESQFVTAMQSLGPQGDSNGSAAAAGTSTSGTASSADAALTSAMQSFLQSLAALEQGDATASTTATSTAASSTTAASTSTAASGTSVTDTAKTILQDLQNAATSYQAASASLEQALLVSAGVSVAA